MTRVETCTKQLARTQRYWQMFTQSMYFFTSRTEKKNQILLFDLDMLLKTKM